RRRRRGRRSSSPPTRTGTPAGRRGPARAAQYQASSFQESLQEDPAPEGGR
ncbi:unnamed protein product, partial [Tetraodon nigroviridis]